MLFVLITKPLLLKSIEGYRDLVHLMSSEGTVTLGCDYSFCLTPHHTSILLLMIYTVRGGQVCWVINFSTDFCLEIMLAHTFRCLLVHDKIQVSFFNYCIQKKKIPPKPHPTNKKKKKQNHKTPTKITKSTSPQDWKVHKIIAVLWELLQFCSMNPYFQII